MRENYYYVARIVGFEPGKGETDRFHMRRKGGASITFSIGNWYTVKIVQNTSNIIGVWVNGVKLTSFTDAERPYTAGSIGFYAEDAHVHFDDVVVAQ